MKNIYKYLAIVFLATLISLPWIQVFAGNKDRAGQAGASELLINPWARNSGWGGANVACVRGIDGIFNNVAGIAHTPKTELSFSYADWLKGADVKLMTAGLAQRVGESGVFGFSFMSLNFGDIEITEVDEPEGGIGKFSPRYLNINISYAKAFSNSIYGGMNLKVISESIADASAEGIALDAGIQYVTGEKENIKFGISLRNIGIGKLKFKGDGYSLQTFVPNNDNQFTTTQRGASFEIPTQLNIGAAYDFLIEKSRFTLAGAFISNSFKKDQFALGAEYSFRDYVLLRAGYTYEDGITKPITDPDKTNVERGFTGGFSVQAPLKKGTKSVFAVDYSIRPVENFKPIHTIGVRFTL
ncbi:MAG: PorV/PorQ family protein [Bacteroidetes bacterium]|nr:PorV/PorQ family protein [Bacteroidota bacterium]